MPAKLTDAEKTAIDNFLTAAKNLPKTLCVEINDDDYHQLTIYKRSEPGMAIKVAGLRKQSLYF